MGTPKSQDMGGDCATVEEQGRVLLLDPARANETFRPVVEWLNRRAPTEKLAAAFMAMLFDGDTQDAIQATGYYDGNLGHELQEAWLSLVEDTTHSDALPPQERALASLLLGFWRGTEA